MYCCVWLDVCCLLCILCCFFVVCGSVNMCVFVVCQSYCLLFIVFLLIVLLRVCVISTYFGCVLFVVGCVLFDVCRLVLAVHPMWIVV